MSESYKELRAQAEQLLQRADQQLLVEKQEGIRRAREIIDEFGLTAYDLGFDKALKTSKPKAPKTTRPPKYRDPNTGRTWSGYGHQPKWIEGDKEEYLINRQ